MRSFTALLAPEAPDAFMALVSPFNVPRNATMSAICEALSVPSNDGINPFWTMENSRSRDFRYDFSRSSDVINWMLKASWFRSFP